MFGSNLRGVNAYAQVGMGTQVSAASPHKLITMLFDGAMTAIANAIRQMAEDNIPAKGKSISHAILIIESGLNGALNHEAGGEIAANLEALYVYMSNRLLQANLENDPAKLEEVRKLLGELRVAWDAIDPSQHSFAEAQGEPSAVANPSTPVRQYAEAAA